MLHGVTRKHGYAAAFVERLIDRLGASTSADQALRRDPQTRITPQRLSRR